MNIPTTVVIAVLSVFVINTSHGGDLAVMSHDCKNNRKVIPLTLFPGIMSQVPKITFEGPSLTITSVDNKTKCAVKYDPQGHTNVAVYGKENKTGIRICLKSNVHKEYELNVNLIYCPAGFIHNSIMCVCPPWTNSGILCNQSQSTAYVFVGFCASRESGEHPLLIARCGFANHLIKPLLAIPQNNLTGKTKFCEFFKRRGTLCSKCINNTGISVFSDTFDCIPCNHLQAGKLILYLVIEFIPTTLFVMAIIFFHIGITNGKANGFIFFAQMKTTPLEVLFLAYGLKLYIEDNHYFDNVLTHLVIDPYCIWNLTIFRMFQQKICLHPKLKVVHVLAMHYISAFYPLLLLIVTYALIELKARNIRIVTYLWRLFCFTCVRYRRVWKARTSVIDAFASCILLSYTKFVLVSLSYFSYSDVRNVNGHHVKKVLSLDTSIHYLGSEHRPFLAIASVILLTFGVFPPLILTFYQFRPFQNVLELLHLKGPGFQRFVEAFQGCYKDGTDGKVDCRFFAGLYFVFRDILLVIYAVSPSFPNGFVAVIIATIFFLLLFTIFQPYKKNLYNAIDGMIISLYAIVTTLQMFIYNQLQQTFRVSHVFLLYYILLLIPLIYMIVHAIHWLYQHWKQRKNQLHTPIDREPDFFRESAIDERRLVVDAPRVNFLRRNNPTQSEVSVSQLELSSECSDEMEEGREEGMGRNRRVGTRKQCEEEDSDKEIRCKPFNERERLLQCELEPVMHYGTT